MNGNPAGFAVLFVVVLLALPAAGVVFMGVDRFDGWLERHRWPVAVAAAVVLFAAVVAAGGLIRPGG